mgnify:CR=1 FL=1
MSFKDLGRPPGLAVGVLVPPPLRGDPDRDMPALLIISADTEYESVRSCPGTLVLDRAGVDASIQRTTAVGALPYLLSFSSSSMDHYTGRENASLRLFTIGACLGAKR